MGDILLKWLILFIKKLYFDAGKHAGFAYIRATQQGNPDYFLFQHLGVIYMIFIGFDGVSRSPKHNLQRIEDHRFQTLGFAWLDL